MTSLATKILATTALMAVMAPAAFAQVPPHGTLPEMNAPTIFTPVTSYSTANPNAVFEWSIMTMGVTAPFESQYLEISTPNTSPLTIDVLTHNGCAQLNPSIVECQVQYPLSTADMTSTNVMVTARYYVTKNGGAFERYDRNVGSVSGQAGSTGSVPSGSGTTIPTVTQIPPHTSITGDTPFHVNVSSSLANYSSTNNILPINLVITPISPPSSISPPYANELLEIKSPTGAVKSLNIASACTRSAPNNMTLTCNTSYVLPAADAAQPNLMFEGRYFANDLYPNSLVWTGYSSGTTLLQGTTTTGGGGNTTANCPPETNPMMPTNTNTNVNGSVFEFTQNIADVCPNTFWIDPPIAIGYSYAASGAKFESVTLPSLQTVADSDGYTLHYNLNGWQTVAVSPSSQHVFPSPVSTYQVKGISPGLGLDLHDPAAFAIGVKLTDLNGTQVKITQIPMPFSTGVILDDPIHERLKPRRVKPDAVKRRLKIDGPTRLEPGKVKQKAFEARKLEPQKADPK